MGGAKRAISSAPREAREPASVARSRRHVALPLAALAVAACLLFHRLSHHDPLTDEQEIAFRAVGYLDFLAAPYQTTPYEWFATPPWWVRLSFHDHPPLLFALEHVVFRIFGDSLLALRVPFALLGIASLVLLGAIARRLYGECVAAIVMALGAVNTYWLWTFRIGLQEGPVIFFLLASLYCLVRARDAPRWLVAWGAVTGLGLLTKYTAVVAFPISLAYLCIVAPALLRRRELWIGLLASAVVFSPVVVYNIALLRTVGHFDLQLATLLGQATPEWTVLPGKAIGSLSGRLASLGPEFWRNATWPFGVLVGGSLLVMLGSLQRSATRSANLFVVVALLITTLLVVVIGPSQRFLAMLVPFALLACASALALAAAAGRLARRAATSLFAAALVVQGLVSFETLHAERPRGDGFLAVSPLRHESAAYGYGALEQYLHDLLDGARPAAILELPSRLRFIESLRARHLRHTGGPRQARLVVYDPRINNVAKLWLYDRRYYYDGWPIVSVDEYQHVRDVYPNLFSDLGIADYYFVAVEDGLGHVGMSSPSQHAEAFKARLTARQPERVLVGPDGRRTFTVYRSETEF